MHAFHVNKGQFSNCQQIVTSWRSPRPGTDDNRCPQALTEFDSERNHTYIRQQLGAQSVIPRQARKENLASSWSARRDAASISATALPAPIPDREPVQFGEAQALGPCAGPLAAHPKAPSPAARFEFQSVSPEASLTFLEDVNRAR